jgi:hypothetical protein
MRGITAALKGLEDVLGLPPWAVGLIFVGVLYLIFSQIMKGGPAARARGLVVRAAVAEARARVTMEAEALKLVWDDPLGLLVVGQEALRRGSKGTAEKAVARLKDIGAEPDKTRALAEQVQGRPTARPEGEIVAIRNMIENELWDMARERVARARATWPDEEAFVDLAARVPERDATPT